MRSWERFIELFQPLEPTPDIKALIQSAYEDGLKVGYEVGVGYVADQASFEFEKRLAGKMKKKFRAGYAAAVEDANDVFDLHESRAFKGLLPQSPFWKAQYSWTEGRDGSVTEEWDVFDY